MDKVKLHSPLKSIIPPHIIENNFQLVNINSNIKYGNKNTYEDDRGINIDVSCYGTHIRVNPTKFTCGHNLKQINRMQLLSFIEEFEDHLQVDTEDLKVTGFDFNQDVETRNPVMRYIPLFRKLPRYNTWIPKECNGTGYKNNCKTFCIYDKLDEAKNHKQEVPARYQNKHLMRLEYGVNQKMSQDKDFAGISTLRALGDIENYKIIIRRWKNMYDKIEKQPLYPIGELQKPETMSHDDFILLFYLNSIGFQNYLNQINDEKLSGKLTRGQAKRRRDGALRVWGEYPSISAGHDLLKELNNLVQERYQSCLQEEV
jgi:hypothetical protein